MLAEDNLLWREKCREAGLRDCRYVTLYTAHIHTSTHPHIHTSTHPHIHTSTHPHLQTCRHAHAHFRDSRRRGKITTGFVYSPWKSGFMRQHNIEMNWRLNPIRNPKVTVLSSVSLFLPPQVLRGHDDHVITCLQFSGNRIVSGSDDNTLKVTYLVVMDVWVGRFLFS